ncbi:hypothetical protein ACQKKX_04830 [Neorhizobium sp. NPDC001467]|uniref:hypothetical protein n=1 Tax=Neorhizobium sp. NPDC001467 TaxID=3390595 RepID=UPI003D025FBB
MSGSSTNVFISEIVRSANEIDKIGDAERGRLLDRAARTIREMRIESGIRASGSGSDRLMAIVSASRIPALYSDNEIKLHLLDAAAMMRDLHIVLDTNTSISIGNDIP